MTARACLGTWRAVAFSALATVVACTTYRPTAAERSPPPLVPGAVRVYAVGDIADCRVDAAATAAAATARLVPPGSTVLGLGDIAYPWADAATLERCFTPTWGAHRSRMLAIAGNHDYVDGSSASLRRYFALDAFAASAEFLAYAQRLSDDWLLLALDSNVTGATMERQRAWLERTLAQEQVPRGDAASGPRCLAVMWHTPVFSSGWHRGSGDHMRPLWQLIDAYQADLLLSGHEHFYEAYGPIDGTLSKRDDGDGVRQFTVGTGGARLYGFWRPPYASRARVLEHGVLELTLAPGRYAWRFIDTAGRVRDAGAAQCRRAP